MRVCQHFDTPSFIYYCVISYLLFVEYYCLTCSSTALQIFGIKYL